MESPWITLEFLTNPIKGYIISRPTRFTLLIKLEGREEVIYLPNPGALSTVIHQGREILCLPNHKIGRKTRFDGFAVRIGDFYATIDSRYANTIFEKTLRKKSLFPGFSILSKEKILRNYGRIDFLVKSIDGSIIYVEVKSCTHVENGVAKFPDRPTKRGRKHLKALQNLVEQGKHCWIVFVVQRPDAVEFHPFKEVDHEFSELLDKSVRFGVEVHVFKTQFMPPNKIYLKGKIPLVL